MNKTLIGGNLRAGLLGTALTLIITLPASAGTVLAGLGPTWQNFTPYDISTGVDAWTIYGGIGTFGNSTDLTWGGTATSSFSVQTNTLGTTFGPYLYGGGLLKYAYSGANAGSTYPASTASSDTTIPKYENNSGASNVTITHTMIGTDEDLSFVIAGNTGNSITWVGNLSSGGTGGSTGTFSSNSNGNNLGIVTYNLLGNAGDVFTFTVTQNFIGSQTAAGISSAQLIVNAVPEPSTWALLGMGVLGLVVLRRRQKSVA